MTDNVHNAICRTVASNRSKQTGGREILYTTGPPVVEQPHTNYSFKLQRTWPFCKHLFLFVKSGTNGHLWEDANSKSYSPLRGPPGHPGSGPGSRHFVPDPGAPVEPRRDLLGNPAPSCPPEGHWERKCLN